ncbi:uncharacterized protein [Dipodomys merriami]|uniref:uncharacterized protein n=1 Tax=Dipodomys merriami TaxID=94247 RepID=UPI0038559AA9
MADCEDENPENPKREKSPAKEVTGPSPTPEKGHTEAVLSKKKLEGEERSQLETIKAEGEGAAVSQDSHDQPTEKREGSPEASLPISISSQLKEVAGGSAPPNPLGSVCKDSPGISGDGPDDKTPDDNTTEDLMDVFLRGQQIIFQMLRVVENLKIRLLHAEYILGEATQDLMTYVEGDYLQNPGIETYPVNKDMDNQQSLQRSHTEKVTSKSQLSKEKGEGDINVEAVAAPDVVPDPLPAVLEEIKANKKRELTEEIEMLGQKYERVFQLLEEGKRSQEVNKELLVFALKEAVRFKCCNLIQHLEKLLKHVDTHTLE